METSPNRQQLFTVERKRFSLKRQNILAIENGGRGKSG
jgi:hypothetical protein